LASLLSERQALRSSVMCDNRPYLRLLCATMPVIGDTPCRRVAGAHMRKRGRGPPVMLGAQIVQTTELRIVGEWPGGCQCCIPLAFGLCHSLLWMIRSGGQIVDITPRYCWSFSFHATRLLLLRWILEILGPSTTAYARHNFRHLGDDQQYPPIIGNAPSGS
jgi:hypothetical protein